MFIMSKLSDKRIERKMKKAVKKLNKKGIHILPDIDKLKKENQTKFEYLKSKFNNNTAVHVYTDMKVKNFVAEFVN